MQTSYDEAAKDCAGHSDSAQGTVHKQYEFGIKDWISARKRDMTAGIEHKLKRRNAVDPLIGHLACSRQKCNFVINRLGGRDMSAFKCL